jgi:hypothetical protein
VMYAVRGDGEWRPASGIRESPGGSTVWWNIIIHFSLLPNAGMHSGGSILSRGKCCGDAAV